MNSRWKIVAVAILGVAVGLVVGRNPAGYLSNTDVAETVAHAAGVSNEKDWAATGPGRIEPVSGEIRISSSAGGRITRISVRENDVVEAGALLAELENGEQTARVAAAEADVAFRQTERDRDVSNDADKDRHVAEDAVAVGEQNVTSRRGELDRQKANSPPERSSTATSTAKAALEAAEQQLVDARKALQLSSAMSGAVPPSRTVSALAVARAELAVAVANLEKTKLRAPQNGTVLLVRKRIGESVSTSADDAVFVVADVSHLRVRVELNERDVGRVNTGQHVVIKSEAYSGVRFEGHVTSIAPATRPKKIGEGLNGTPTSEQIVEVLVELDQAKPLIVGLRVDAYFEQPKNETVGDIEHAKP